MALRGNEERPDSTDNNLQDRFREWRSHFDYKWMVE